MAGLRVFVSSTCADLDAYRLQLRGLLSRMGYEPVMSDHSEVLFDPTLHTHASCLRDVQSADIVILLIGSRFGGTTVPQAISTIDFDTASKASTNSAILNEKDKISITQAEAIQAVIIDRPIFTFVDSKVYSDHHVYQANKGSPNLFSIKFPSITKQETASSIFEFINFLTHRSFNNSVQTFHSFTDIEDHLLKQWSLLFQRLIQDKREKSAEVKRSADIVGRIDQLQAAILQVVPQGHARDVARAIVRYRRMIDFLYRTMQATQIVNLSTCDLEYFPLLKTLGIDDVIWDDRMESPYLALLMMNDGGFIGCNTYTDDAVRDFEQEWDNFRLLAQDVREAVVEASSELASDRRDFERHSQSLEDYYDSLSRSEDDSEAIARPRPRRRPLGSAK